MIPDATLAAVIRKCEQYWNEPVPEAPEFHAILEFIHREASAGDAEIRRLREEQSFHDGLDDGIIRRLRAQVETLHGLVEDAVNGWKATLPHEDDVSMLVKQDRLTCHDLMRKADAIFMSGGGKARLEKPE